MDNKKELILPLKKQWWDMIKSGVKKEEYREMKPFYISRFSGGLMKDIVDVEADPDTICKVFNRRYSKVSFTRGYPNSSLESTYHTELREQISEVLMRYGIECEFKTNDDDGFYCIDHGSELADFVAEIANSENLLLDYLFGDAYVETGNDNDEYSMPNDPSDEYDYIYEKGN